MTQQSHDKEFAAFLGGESDLSERYAELGDEVPPSAIDARILAEARAAANIHQVEFGPRGGWLKPVALAATVLLSFSLVMNLVIESPTRFEQVVSESVETGSRVEAMLPAKKSRALETPQAAIKQPSAPMVAEQGGMVEESSIVGDNSIASVESEADHGMARSLETLSVTVRLLDRETGLLIVARYVAAADKNVASGLVGTPEIKSANGGKMEKLRPKTADSVAPGARSADDSEALLRDIEHLRVNEKIDEAETRLKAFLKNYPDHPVSIEIRQLDN